MPNWCNNSITISGPKDKITKLYNDAVAENGLLQVMYPMPKELEDTTSPAPKEGEPQPLVDGYDNWYDWRVNNWGTKWDVVDVQITQPLTLHDDEEDVAPESMNASFSFNCWTAWSPPILVWNTLVNMGISVDADYQDEGMMFEGTYVNGEEKMWEPEIEEDEEDA